MPGLEFTSGIDRGFEKDLSRMNKSMNKFSTNVESQTQQLDDSFSELGSTIRNTVSILAIGAAGREIINFNKDLETSLKEVQTISGAVTEDFEGYRDILIEMATQSNKTAIELGNAFYDVVSAGYDGAAGLELLNAANKASVAGFVDIKVAADGLTTVLNAWKLEATESGRVNDVLFNTVKYGKTTFDQLAGSIAVVAPLAASAGIPLEEITAAIATLTKQGTPTAQAITQIRSSIIAMNPILGDGWSELMTYQEAIQQVADKAGGSQTQLKDMLGRVEAVNGVLGLTGINAKGAAQDLLAMSESAGVVDAAFDQVTESADFQINQLKNNLLATFSDLGNDAVKTISKLAGNLNEAFDSGDIDKYLTAIKALSAAFITYKVSTLALSKAAKIRTANSLRAAQLEGLYIAKNLTAQEKQQLGITNINKLTKAQLLTIKQKQVEELRELQIIVDKQKVIKSSAIIEAQKNKLAINSLNAKIAAEKIALTQAKTSGDLTKYKIIQQRIENLENQKASAVITQKATTEKIATATKQGNIAATQAGIIQTRLDTATTKGATATKNAFTIATLRLTTAMRAMRVAFATNPIGLIVTALSLAIPFLIDFNDELSKSEELAQDLNDVTDKTTSAVEKETRALGTYRSMLSRTEPGSARRVALINELNDEYPDLLKNIDGEQASMGDLNKVFDTYIKNLEKVTRLKILQSKLEELIAEQESVSSNAELSEYEAAIESKRIQQRKDALFAEIQYQKNVVDLGKQYADLFKEREKILAEIEKTPELVRELGDEVLFTFEQFKKAYLFTLDEGAQPDSDNVLRDRYKAYLAAADESLKDADDLQSKLAAINAKLLAIEEGTLGTGGKTGAGTVAQLQTIKKLEDEISDLETKRQEQTGIVNQAELDRLQVEIDTKQARVDQLNKSLTERTLEAAELTYQKEINLIEQKYGTEEKLAYEKNEALLQAEREYLEKVLTLTKDKLEQEQIRGQIQLIDDESLQNQKDQLSALVDQFKTYTEQRTEIEKDYQEKINDLYEKGYGEKAKVAERALARELEELDDNILKQNKKYQDWLEKDLPKAAEAGVVEIQKRLQALNERIKLDTTLSPEDILVITNMIEKLNKATATSTKSFQDTVEVMNNVRELTNDLVDSFGNAGSEIGIMVKGIAGATQGFVGMLKAIKGIDAAASDLDKASAVLIALSAAVKVYASLQQAVEDIETRRTDAAVKQIKYQQVYNRLLIEQNQLAEESTSYFSQNRWQEALRGLGAYNNVLGNQKDILLQIQTYNEENIQGVESFGKSYLESLITPLGGFSLAVKGVRKLFNKEAENIKVVDPDKVKSDVEAALNSILATTKDRGKFAETFGFEDQFESLLSLYPELVDANGQLNTELLKTVVNTENLSEENQQFLEGLIENTDLLETAYDQFAQYISSIFGNVAGEVTKAFQDMYEGGDQSLKGLSASMSTMIENFTRDTIEFALLQPFIDKLDKATKESATAYAKGDIPAAELQEDVISSLGEFYNNLSGAQEDILDAFKKADELAEQAGFESAFSGDAGGPDKAPAGAIVSAAITEESASSLVGRLGAIMLSNQIIADNSSEIYQNSLVNLVVLNAIKEYTSYLPQIAENTRRTVENLEA